VEIEFCELRLDRVLGYSAWGCGTLERKEGDVVLLLPTLPYEGVQFLHQEVPYGPLHSVLGDQTSTAVLIRVDPEASSRRVRTNLRRLLA
jgi:hypothetical protein